MKDSQTQFLFQKEGTFTNTITLEKRHYQMIVIGKQQQLEDDIQAVVIYETSQKPIRIKNSAFETLI
eukprot:CAMPEP_0117421776 /NCGR_PEP_ID=MMETSP0758-20121206/2763_1 /TAXON_ID=63605 /ORGANISM="Percolomonas cosmopolitus, Strain AE-1 (ATCC 50343)" /LENGTH=66 /DNA_ID=CAMNT_0005204029 /DNA_START=420 /DNA_END=617 /DNA_ORIENTATION=-